MLNTVCVTVLESSSYTESYFQKKNNMSFLKELSSLNKTYISLVWLEDEDSFIGVFLKLEDKNRMKSYNLISVYYISDEINALMEVNFDDNIYFVISMIPNIGSFIWTIVYIGLKVTIHDEKENAFVSIIMSSKIATLNYKFDEPVKSGYDSMKKILLSCLGDEGIVKVKTLSEASFMNILLFLVWKAVFY